MKQEKKQAIEVDGETIGDLILAVQTLRDQYIKDARKDLERPEVPGNRDNATALLHDAARLKKLTHLLASKGQKLT